MAKMITLSFKDNEMELYEHVKSKSSPSIYIKELVSNDMNGIMKSKKDEQTKHNNDNETSVDSEKQNNIKLSTLKMVGR